MKIVSLVCALAAGSLTLLSPSSAESDSRADQQPNVVMVLVDDMSENLYPYMTEVTRLRAEGVTFLDYFNATPWCCPSRASLQTGKYPHNTDVLSNVYPNGGFQQFMQKDMSTAIGVQLQAAGYRTGFIGKYLNGYVANGRSKRGEPSYPANYVPPGWNSWFSGVAYHQFAYRSVYDESDDDQPAVSISNKDADPADYYQDVMNAHAQDFLHRPSDQPFFLLLTPFAPHAGTGLDPEGSKIVYPAAPRDRGASKTRPAAWGPPEFANGDCGPVACEDVPWPDTLSPGNYNKVESNPLGWMPKTPIDKKVLDRDGRRSHIQRIQMLQSVNDMLRDVRATLEETGQADNTYIMFTSDNGYHIGEHALITGKTTPYDHDVKTPLIVRPPGGMAPASSSAMVQNVDILPTIVSIAGGVLPVDVDGVSLLPLMTQPDLPWRDSVLLELLNDFDQDEPGGGRMGQRNPDVQSNEVYVSPSYNAIRAADYLYVDYSKRDDAPPKDSEAEYYDLHTDPAEIVNLYPALSAETRAALNTQLLLLTACEGEDCPLLEGYQAPGYGATSAE